MFVLTKTLARGAGFLRDFRNGRSGNIAIMSALLAPVVLGTFGLGTEVASWYSIQRSMQNAADSAVTAAATNGSAAFADEARAVTMRYGFTNGQDGVVVTPLENQPCPDGITLECYRVTVSKPVPLMLAKVVGFQGNSEFGGQRAELLKASAVAIQDTAPRPYCIVALAKSGQSPAIHTNGNPNANLVGCNIISNTDATCNGHDLNADVADAHGVNDGCGLKRHSNVPKISDQYAGLADKIPDVNCSAYPQIPSKKHGVPLPPQNQISGTIPLASPMKQCGDVELLGDVTINTGSDGALLVIKNGSLDLNGHTLRTSNGSALTIIFTGDNGPNYDHILTGGGMIDINAPDKNSHSDWKGVAVYTDPKLTQNVDVAAAGNSPAWDITGLVYMPNADVTFSGAVNKSSNGKSCFVMVVDTLLVNGTGSILAHGECEQAGVIMPTNPVPSRGKLVS